MASLTFCGFIYKAYRTMLFFHSVSEGTAVSIFCWVSERLKFNVLLGTKDVILGDDLQVSWPNQRCQSAEGQYF